VRDRLVPFDDYYDRSAVEQSLLRLGIRIASRNEEEVVGRSQRRNAARAFRPPSASEREGEPPTLSPEDGAMHHYRVTTRGMSRDVRWYADLAEMLSRRDAAPFIRAAADRNISSAQLSPASPEAASAATGTPRVRTRGDHLSTAGGPALGGDTGAAGVATSSIAAGTFFSQRQIVRRKSQFLASREREFTNCTNG